MKIFQALCFCLACHARDIPPPPADNALPAWSAIKGSAEVGRMFRCGPATPKAVWSDRGCIILPANFSEARHERVTWDVKMALDLRMAKGVQFDFFSEDLSPFTYFSLYFRSGKGWYHATFTPDRQGVWQRIVIDKSEIKNVEGQVSGWGEVDTLRISGWRLR
ncbi:MAG: hypothetical protein PHE10_10930, partial [Kiritimatiellae bacterium]|nr:hypothetical protein [Kiritimatiellia bacterium]